MIDYFFSGKQYIRVSRFDTGPGSINSGYPAPISNWGWGNFGVNGIDAALYSGSKCYFFSGKQYIRMTRGVTGPGTVDPGYPAPISNWNWGAFGANGIDAALWSGSKCYFFSGKQYIRVTRGDTGPGSIDSGYPAPISNWRWGNFGANGIDSALYSGSRCYFFSGNQYVRVRRSDMGPGILDAGYPAPISNWNWGAFGVNGIKGALYSGGPLVAPPSGGTVGNVNYFLEDGGNPLTGVSVTIDFDVDFVSTSNAYSFQLNGYSTEGRTITSEWQQFVIYASPGSTQLIARIETWAGTSLSDELNRIDVPLANMPSTTIKAGYSFNITFTYNNSNGAGTVTGAVFTATDENGNTLGTATIGIVGQLLRTTNKPATSADLAPIAAFQFNIGGDYGSATAALTTGAGTVTYSATNALAVMNSEPSYTDFNDGTAENANINFGPLPQASSQMISQSFQATAISAARSELKPQLRARRGDHMMVPPDERSRSRHVMAVP